MIDRSNIVAVLVTSLHLFFVYQSKSTFTSQNLSQPVLVSSFNERRVNNRSIIKIYQFFCLDKAQRQLSIYKAERLCLSFINSDTVTEYFLNYSLC